MAWKSLILTASLVTGLSLPAHAEEVSPRREWAIVDPVLAALAPPLAVTGLMLIPMLTREPGTSLLIPLGTGAGQLLAGHTSKGIFVSLGGYGALLAGTGLGYVLDTTLIRSGPSVGVGPQGWTGMVVGSGLAFLLYTGWACWDAHQTVERANRERSGQGL